MKYEPGLPHDNKLRKLLHSCRFYKGSQEVLRRFRRSTCVWSDTSSNANFFEIRLPSDMPRTEVIKLIKDGERGPGTLIDLLKECAADPNFGLHFPIMAVGTTVVTPGGKRNAPVVKPIVICEGDKKRTVRVIRFERVSRIGRENHILCFDYNKQ